LGNAQEQIEQEETEKMEDGITNRGNEVNEG
jgi:hypothetical protein